MGAINLPDCKNVICLKWMFKTKFHANRGIQKQEAWLVAKRNSPHQVINFEETFSLVVRFETMKIFLFLVAQLQWLVYQFDDNSTLLNGELEE